MPANKYRKNNGIFKISLFYSDIITDPGRSHQLMILKVFRKRILTGSLTLITWGKSAGRVCRQSLPSQPNLPGPTVGEPAYGNICHLGWNPAKLVSLSLIRRKQTKAEWRAVSKATSLGSSKGRNEKEIVNSGEGCSRFYKRGTQPNAMWVNSDGH